MSKVWVVISSVSYECQDIRGVYGSKTLADKRLSDIKLEKSSYDGHYYDEYEVDKDYDC